MTPTAPSPVPIVLIEASFGLSGSTISLCTLVKRLDRTRYAPHVIVARAEQETYLRDRLDPTIPIVRISPPQGFKRASWALRGKSLGRVAALLDLGAVTLPYALALRRYLRRQGIRLVHHNNGFDEAAVLVCRALRIPLVAYQRGREWRSWTVRRLARLATRYVANSEATREDLLMLGIAERNITVVCPPVELDDFDEARGPRGPAPRRATYGVPSDASCFGIVGQLQEWKGQKVFLQAAAKVLAVRPDAWAWVIGSAPAGGEAYAQELHTLARTLGIADRVVFTGFVADVPGYLRLLDVVVHASTYPEPFGRVIVEAMLSGRPVVASDAGGPREIIVPGRTGLLATPGDAASLSTAIHRLLDDPGLRAELAHAAAGDARQRFSAAQHARRIEEIYRCAISGDADGASEQEPGHAAPSHDGGHR
jgi:glycosyltransferase involved in cell wall biosynthesis